METKRGRVTIFSSFNTCFDMDGVICEDITNPEEYPEAKPLLLPSGKVFAIVTGRLECYREITEKWLRKHGVSYRFLILKPDFLKGVEKTPLFKANKYLFYKESGLFIESSKQQAEKIYFYSEKPVFCIENNQFYHRKEDNRC